MEDDRTRPDQLARDSHREDSGEAVDDRTASIGTDPFLDEFRNTPYDPLYSAQAAGRLTGEAINHPRFGRWMRIVALVIAIVFVLGTLMGAGVVTGVFG
jgi:hypothetical protein